MKKYGLLGRHLEHSYSPAIHKLLGSWPYDLYEREPEELEAFILHGDWNGLNVTIPYKKTVVQYCDSLSPLAKALGSVNTLVRRADGSIYGDNTDFYGFQQMALGLGISYEGKKALVFGSGGASVTVQAVLKELGCHVTVISRSGENNYENLSKHKDAAVLVNTTPVGMYPNNGQSPVCLDGFPQAEAVLDVVYNPARTAMMLEAEKRGIPHASGLHMLVAQAVRASEQFTGHSISRETMETVYKQIAFSMENLILIGMPGCGKSTLGKLLAEHLNRSFYDADQEIIKEIGMPIPDFFAQHDENAFREVETKVLARLGSQSGAVIATGGGCVTREVNYGLLHQNGSVLWIRRDLSLLPSTGRPVTQRDGVEAIYKARKPLYEAFSDVVIDNDQPLEEVVGKILEAIR